jgi:hypothetical protein
VIGDFDGEKITADPISVVVVRRIRSTSNGRGNR